ncbi:MAG: glycerol-3-phosphate 1-O-acyltransferase [Thermoleophilia bacterium]|nr:glycerol-3-phosphate 1-O-acyltransferase [Thermoleophilia bacterium]
MNFAIAIIAAYFLGAMPFALLAGKMKGVDLRAAGSGNLGATNVFRNLGRTAGIVVMALDIAKGVGAVLIAESLTGAPWPMVAGAVAIIGHVFPVWTKFRGGKGVAVGAGVLIGLAPAAAGVMIGIWVVLVLVTRYVSVASIIAALSAAPLAWAFGTPWSYVGFVALVSLVVIGTHRGNIVRLARGEETRISFGRKAPAPPRA